MSIAPTSAPALPSFPPAGKIVSMEQQAARGAFDFKYQALYHLLSRLEPLIPRWRQNPANRPLRVCRLSSVIAQGGVAKVCLQTILATDLNDARIQLNVFNSPFPLPEPLEQRPDIKVSRRKMPLWPGSYDRRMFKAIFKLAWRLRKFRPDVVHVHEPQFAPAARMAAILAGGVPLFVHMHNCYDERWDPNQRSSIQDRLMRDALRHSHIIACSQTILDAAARWLDLPLEAIRLIEDGSDDVRSPQPADAALLEALGKAAAGRQVLAKMSHIMPHKRIEDFMAACRILLDEGYPIFVLLMCYGKARARALLRQQFDAMFAPWEGELLVHVADAQALLPQVAIGVSASALEGLGLNILEFQVAGLPVVCTDLQPHREMVEDEASGLLYETGNVPQLVAQLRRLLDDPALAARIAQGGLQSAQRRTWKNTARKTVEFYREVLGNLKFKL